MTTNLTMSLLHAALAHKAVRDAGGEERKVSVVVEADRAVGAFGTVLEGLGEVVAGLSQNDWRRHPELLQRLVQFCAKLDILGHELRRLSFDLGKIHGEIGEGESKVRIFEFLGRVADLFEGGENGVDSVKNVHGTGALVAALLSKPGYPISEAQEREMYDNAILCARQFIDSMSQGFFPA
jgi:hypothetical protein